MPSVFLCCHCSALQTDAAYGANRSSSRPRGAAPDRLDRRLRCDKGSRNSSGRLDDCGSPCATRVDPLLEEYKNNRTRKWEMRVSAAVSSTFVPNLSRGEGHPSFKQSSTQVLSVLLWASAMLGVY